MRLPEHDPKIDYANLDTSKVTNMSWAFDGATPPVGLPCWRDARHRKRLAPLIPRDLQPHVCIRINPHRDRMMTESPTNILSSDDSAQVRDALIEAARMQGIGAKPILTQADAAAILGKSTDTVRRMITNGLLPRPNSLGLWNAKNFKDFIANPQR